MALSKSIRNVSGWAGKDSPIIVALKHAHQSGWCELSITDHYCGKERLEGAVDYQARFLTDKDYDAWSAMFHDQENKERKAVVRRPPSKPVWTEVGGKCTHYYCKD